MYGTCSYDNITWDLGIYSIASVSESTYRVRYIHRFGNGTNLPHIVRKMAQVAGAECKYKYTVIC